MFKAMWLTKQKNNAHAYGMNLYVRGKKTKILVDDYVPMVDNRPAFAKISRDNGFWAPLAEKMWAKINVNYDHTTAGWMSEGLDALTGAPSFTYETKGLSDSAVWNLIVKADKGHEILTTGSVENNVGIVPMHAYTLIGFAEVKLTNG